MTPEVLDPVAGWWLSWRVRGRLGESQIQMATGKSGNDDPASLRPMSKRKSMSDHNREATALQSTSMPHPPDWLAMASASDG